ncbi:glutathione S-transferase [Auriculariales sp. MPI-PUGE-AT-0066]|nr:glutathione S-transferase [Auriculariales sp. MPI-PUGE-AT-0066]
MSHPDADNFPHATGNAARTVAAHEADQSDVVLYGSWFCPFVQRTWVTLEEKGVPYRYVEINPYLKQPEFLALNPKGLVPTAGVFGKPIYESLILNELFEELYNEPNTPRLLPADPVEKARARIWIDYIAKTIVPGFMKVVMAQSQDDQKARLQEFYDSLRKLCDERDAEGPFFLGANFGLVDAAIAPWVVRDHILAEHRAYDRSGAGQTWVQFAAALESRPSVIKTTSDRERYAPIYGRYLRNESQSEFANALRQGKPF